VARLWTVPAALLPADTAFKSPSVASPRARPAPPEAQSPWARWCAQ
jgi:hypothetical protein